MKTGVWKNTGGLLHRMFLNGGMTTVPSWLNSITLSQCQGYRQDAVSSSGCPTCRHTYPLAPPRWQDVWSAGQCLSEVSTVWSLIFPWQLKLILERSRGIWKYCSPPHTLPLDWASTKHSCLKIEVSYLYCLWWLQTETSELSFLPRLAQHPMSAFPLINLFPLSLDSWIRTLGMDPLLSLHLPVLKPGARESPFQGAPVSSSCAPPPSVFSEYFFTLWHKKMFPFPVSLP